MLNDLDQYRSCIIHYSYFVDLTCNYSVFVAIVHVVPHAFPMELQGMLIGDHSSCSSKSIV